MPLHHSCYRVLTSVAATIASLGAAFAQTTPTAPVAPGVPAVAAPTAAAPPPLVPLPFNEAVLKAATDLFAKANVPAGSAKLEVVIDPLVDGVSGAQTAATRDIGRRLEAFLKTTETRFDVKPFNSTSVAKSPYLLIGTFTAINAATNQPAGQRDVYRFCLALADLKSGKVVGKGVARAKPEGIDSKPAAAFEDSPMWIKDPAIDGYVKTCQATKLGDSIDPAYLANISNAANISDAILAYDRGKYSDSLKFYTAVSTQPGGDQLRVLNGLYLNNWKLNRKKEAAVAFGKMVDYGMKSEKLAMKFLFQPGSSGFIRNPRIASAYPLWLQQIAQRADAANACLEVVGHTSATGLAPLNARLSAARAEYVTDRLSFVTPKLRPRMISTGAGSRELLIGTGKDNASDALDRRVEFKVIKCGSAA
jgi:outer membrane protein OmpA-like peptidoglycan-associated protein